MTAAVTETAPVTATTPAADGQPAVADMDAMHGRAMGMQEDMATLKGMATTPEMKALMEEMDTRMQGVAKGLMSGQMDAGTLHDDVQAMLVGMDKLMGMEMTSEQQTQMHKVHTELKIMMDEILGAGASSTAAAAAPAGGQPGPDMDAMHERAMGMQGDMAALKGMATTPEMKAVMEEMDSRMQGMAKGLMSGQMDAGTLHDNVQAMLDGMDKLMTMEMTSEQQTQMHKVHTQLQAMMDEMMAGQGAAGPSADAPDAPAADQTDHAAHHPQGQNASGGDAGGMMGDMGGMMGMDAMMKMHASMQDMMGMMDKMQGMEMSPEMKAMMGDMKGMMDGMMKDMPMGDMMGGQGMGDMPAGGQAGMPAGGQTDHAAHHPQGQNAPDTQSGGMMGGMGMMDMGSMMKMHAQMKGMMDKMMGMEMSPEMKSMMGDMKGMMDGMMKDMPMGDMMGGQAMGDMPAGGQEGMPAGGQTDHAAHHPQGQTAPDAAAGGMMGGMGMMDMGSMMKMHARMQGMMDKMMGMEMSPEMKAMMGDMKGMMDGMMKDMPMGDMMGGQDMGAMQDMPMAPMQAMGSASSADAQAEHMMGMMDKMLGMMDEMMGMMKGMPAMGAMQDQSMGAMQMGESPVPAGDEHAAHHPADQSAAATDAGASGDMAGMDHSGGQSAEAGGHSMAPIPSAGVPAATESTGGQPLAFTEVDGVKVFNLTAKPVRWQLTDDVTVTAWTYNGTVPGPMLRATEGDKVRIIFKNELPEATSIHWHGIDVPNVYDGVPGMPTPAIQPGATFTYEFTVNTPGSYMYHSHTASDKQVSVGLYAPFIIDPATPPTDPPAIDQSLMFSEWRVVGGETYPAMPMMGMEPNYFTINGKAFPATEPIQAKVGDKIRLRLMNIGQFVHPIHLHGPAFQIVATDGHPVPAGAQLTKDTVAVAPGERYDIEFTFTEPGMWMVHCHILHHTTNDGVDDGGMMLTIDVTE